MISDLSQCIPTIIQCAIHGEDAMLKQWALTRPLETFDTYYKYIVPTNTLQLRRQLDVTQARCIQLQDELDMYTTEKKLIEQLPIPIGVDSYTHHITLLTKQLHHTLLPQKDKLVTKLTSPPPEIRVSSQPKDQVYLFATLLAGTLHETLTSIGSTSCCQWTPSDQRIARLILTSLSTIAETKSKDPGDAMQTLIELDKSLLTQSTTNIAEPW